MRNVDGSDHREPTRLAPIPAPAPRRAAPAMLGKVVEDRERAHGHESDSDGL
jgi:hypothetical protein